MNEKNSRPDQLARMRARGAFGPAENIPPSQVHQMLSALMFGDEKVVFRNLVRNVRLAWRSLRTMRGGSTPDDILKEFLENITTRNFEELELHRLRSHLGMFRTIAKRLLRVRVQEENVFNGMMRGGEEYFPGMRANFSMMLLNFCASVLLDYPASQSVLCDLVFELHLRRKLVLFELELLEARSKLSRTRNDPALLRAWRRAASRLSTLEIAYARSSDKPLEATISRDRENLRALEDQLAHRPMFGLQRRMWRSTLSNVKRSLAPNAVLLDFAVVQPFDLSLKLHTQPNIRASRYIAFAVDSKDGRPVGFHDIGPVEEVDRMVADCRAFIEGGISHKPGTIAVSATPVRKSDPRIWLYQRLIQPFEEYLESVQMTIISPDGALCRLPFEVLLDQSGSALIERFETSYVGSGRELLDQNGELQGKYTRPIVVAAPDFGVEAEEHAETQLRESEGSQGIPLFLPLDGARYEGEMVANALGGLLFSGREANRRNVLALESPQILHMATHGFFLPERELGSREDARSDAERNDTLSYLAQYGALLRSGLALAGANCWLNGGAVPEEIDTGLLLARDVVLIDLSGTQLVVLSACETGLGETAPGEGIVGLGQSFLSAGAKAIVLSLWKVDDDATCQLMEIFYSYLLGGCSPQKALRLAKTDLRRHRPLLRDWAAFVCRGPTFGANRISKYSVLEQGASS